MINPQKEDVYYDSYGKPHFKNSKNFLSISHSNEMVAVSIDQKATTGIDIQWITDKIIRIKEKFLNPKEQQITSNDPLELTYYWSIKEALFKIYGKKDAFLKENFELIAFEVTYSFASEDQWSYRQLSTLKIKGEKGLFEHTDQAVMKRVL